jgi:hypothetical protein
MSEPSFRFVCLAPALDGAPDAWAQELLADGELALLPGAGGLPAVDRVAHALGLVSVSLLRGEDSAERQADTVIAYAGALALVWIADAFSDEVIRWARDRGPMTLLVQATGPLPEDERRRIMRFVAALGRQSE